MERKTRDHYQGGGKSRTWRKRTPRRTPRKYVVAPARESLPVGARFEFQKRVARIDWRTLHTIDVDHAIREVDIDTLESVLDTVAFGDIQGEDTRNFSEVNFVKIFRLAQLMVEYLLHVQDLLSDHKSALLQSRANMEQKNEIIRSRFLCQRDALLQTRHELKQAKKTLKTYEVMLKVQEKNNQTSQSTQPQAWHCPSCEKAFESSYYLDMHVAKKHQNKQEMTDEKILAVVSTAEEATAAQVKPEMSFAVQAETQQLRDRYQADLQRAETNSNTQVRTLQEDLRQSNNQLHEVQTRLEVLQAQIFSTSPNNSRHGSLLVMEKSKEKCHGPNQERLYELESKFSGLERQVKTLGQDNSRLLKELNVAYTEASDLQFAKRQSAFALETQIDDLCKENQHLSRTMSKVKHTAVQAGFMGERHEKLKAYCQVPENSSAEARLVCSSRMYSPPKSPKIESVESPSKLQEDEANSRSTVLPYHELPEPILAIIEAKEPSIQVCDVSDSQNLDNTTDLNLIQPFSALNNCVGHSPVLRQPPSSGRPEVSLPLKKLNFSGGVMLTNMIEEEPAPLSMHEERRGSSPKQRWTEKDEALRALARPTSWRRRTETISEQPSEGESSPDTERCTHFTSPVKRALRFLTPSPERMRMSYKERPRKPAAAKKSKLRVGGDTPITAEEMRAKLEWEMAASNEEQKKRQKAVQQLLAKELVKEKKKIENGTRNEDPGICKAASPFSFTSKSETLSESENEAEKHSSPEEDEKILRPQDISKVASINVGDVVHTMLESETETETETETQSQKANDFIGQLSKELKKFGIASTTNGISDTTYKSISSALEMQRSVRMSQIHGDERQIVEYERDAVVLHTRMAVRDRDSVVVKSPFNVVTESGSDHSNASQDGVEESVRSNNSDESGCESRGGSRDRDMKKDGTTDVRHSEQSSPQSSESADDILEYNSKNVNWAKHAKAGGSVRLGPRSPPPKGRVQYVSRAYSWEPLLKQANSSRNVRDLPSRGEVLRSIADVVDHSRQSEDEEVNEDAFGLGDWDSDENKEK